VPVDDVDGTPYSQQAPSRPMAALRLRAEESAKRADDEGLLTLLHDLRGDDEWWPHLWAHQPVR